jgi:hypothetical protein
MRVLAWHVHGGWMDAFVRGPHDYLIPRDPYAGEWGRGLAGRSWPAAREVALHDLHGEDVDIVVLQRTEELVLAEALLGRRPGRDVPAVFVEHNAPKPAAATTRHPLADQDDIAIVHVTHFNRLMWDAGRARCVVIEHGIPDPGEQYLGDFPSMALVVNEPVRRGRITGTDLLPLLAEAGPIDAFGMGADQLPAALGMSPHALRPSGDLPTAQLHPAMARRRLYIHPMRWTSLGLSLLEAMHLGMPVVAVQSTEAPRAIPPGAGFVSANVGELVAAARWLLAEPEEAARLGAVGRQAALERYGLGRFLADWNTVIEEEAQRRPGPGAVEFDGRDRPDRWKET